MPKTKTDFSSLHPHRKYKPDDNEPGHLASKEGHHVMGDIQHDDWQLCEAYNEVEGFYIGTWVAYSEVKNVLFPKSNTRVLTKEEISFLKESVTIKTPEWIYNDSKNL